MAEQIRETSPGSDEPEPSLLEVFSGCRRALARIAARFVRPHEVEDIVQETFLKTFEAAARTSIQAPRSFMEATARNIALNFVMRRDNLPKDSMDHVSMRNWPADLPSPEDSIDAEARLLLFCRAVRRLPVRCRRAFLLKKVYGLRREEIARYLNVNESTVQKHIAKGMTMVADYMDSVESSGRADRVDTARKSG